VVGQPARRQEICGGRTDSSEVSCTMLPLARDSVCTYCHGLDPRDELALLFRSFIEYITKLRYFLRGCV